MKTLIILICLLINTGLYAQETEGKGKIDELDNPDAKAEETQAAKKPEGPKAKINNNYLGLNLVYNMATLIEPEVQNSGFGADVFYQSHISNPWAYQFQFGFLYNPFSNPVTDPLDKVYIVEEGREEKYTKDETFFNYSIGFIFSYSLLFKETFGIQAPFLENIVPYFSVGLMSSFVFYKTITYNYEEEPIPFIDQGDNSRWLPAALGIPFGFGFKIIAAPGRVINLMANYTYVNHDNTTQNFAYKDIINFKLGYMHGIKFRL